MVKYSKVSGGAIEKSILYNRGVLYFIFIIALGYLFYVLTVQDFYTFFIFIIIGFLTSFFSKNMVVILSIAMSVSFIFKYGTSIRPEGFEDGEEETKEVEEDVVDVSNMDSIETDMNEDNEAGSIPRPPRRNKPVVTEDDE